MLYAYGLLYGKCHIINKALNKVKTMVKTVDIINIGELYTKDKEQSGLTGVLPREVGELVLQLFDDAYYCGLHGLSLEEYIGALITAGICITLPKDRWKNVIPVTAEVIYNS